jgi:RNA polymerase sigma factor (sigma-70 family)
MSTERSVAATPEEVRLRQLFQEHYRAVWSYVWRRADVALVDDVVAETFTVAWRRLDQVPVDARPWLLGVARRVLATKLRSERRRGLLRERLELEAVVQRGGDAGEGAGSVAEALSRVSETDREAITLIAWDGLTPAQAARVVGQTAGAFRVRLHRAKRRLRQELERSSALPAVARISAVTKEALHE